MKLANAIRPDSERELLDGLRLMLVNRSLGVMAAKALKFYERRGKAA
jgi:hypothetical protein